MQLDALHYENGSTRICVGRNLVVTGLLNRLPYLVTRWLIHLTVGVRE